MNYLFTKVNGFAIRRHVSFSDTSTEFVASLNKQYLVTRHFMQFNELVRGEETRHSTADDEHVDVFWLLWGSGRGRRGHGLELNYVDLDGNPIKGITEIKSQTSSLEQPEAKSQNKENSNVSVTILD